MQPTKNQTKSKSYETIIERYCPKLNKNTIIVTTRTCGKETHRCLYSNICDAKCDKKDKLEECKKT